MRFKAFLTALLIFVLSVPALADVEINAANFPDATFREYLQTTFKKSGENNKFTDAELAKISTISPQSRDITDLTGIKNFPNLTALNCYNNKITKLDVSGLSNLKTLYCNVNELTELNITGCAELVSLDCSGNNLTSLNAANLTKLEVLRCTNPEGKTVKITSLNVTGCTALQELDCRGHGLTSLNLSGLSSLKKVLCNNPKDAPTLESLTLTGCSALEELDLQGNKVASLNASGLSALKKLKANLNLLTSLNLTGCANLEELDVSGNKFAALDLSGKSKLTRLDCTNNAEALSSLNLTNCSAMTELDCRGSSISALNLSGCSALKKVQCNVNNLSTLDLSSCTNLEELDCSGNKLTALDISKCTKLVTLAADINKLSSLNALGAAALKTLYIRANAFTQLDLSGNTALTDLKCGSQTAQETLTAVQDGDNYNVDLSAIVSTTNLNNITSVKGYRNADEFDGTYTASTGTAVFAKQPKKLEYNYRPVSSVTNILMDVTANVTLAGVVKEEKTDTEGERAVIMQSADNNPVNNSTVATVSEDLVATINNLYSSVKYTELTYGDKNYYPTYLKSSGDVASVASLSKNAVHVDNSEKTTAVLFTPPIPDGEKLNDDTVFFIWLMNPSTLGLKQADGTNYKAWPSNAEAISKGYHAPFLMGGGTIQAYGPFLGVAKAGGVAFDITKLYYAEDNSAGYKKHDRGFLPALSVVFYFESAPSANNASTLNFQAVKVVSLIGSNKKSLDKL